MACSRDQDLAARPAGAAMTVERGFGMHREHLGQSLGGDPHRQYPRGPARARERLETGGRHRASFVNSQEAGGHQRVVQFVGVARVGTRLVTHAFDSLRVERADVLRG